MAKIFGLNGVLTGRQGGTVFAVRAGENIARKYQPVVANPSTTAQVEVRAKLKLLSQLSAVLAPAIAIRKQGAISSRNLFTKENYRLATYSDDEADINLAAVQITRGVINFPVPNVSREGGSITTSVSGSNLRFDRVVFVLLLKGSDSKLRLLDSAVVSEETAGAYTHEFALPQTANGVVLAYGVRDNTANARVIFGNLTAPTAEEVAKIITTSTLLESDITMSETTGVNVPAAQ